MTRGGERVVAMLNPPHLGEVIRESMNEVRWNVTQTAARLGCERGTLSRLLDGKAGVSVNTALALEALGWGTADRWMRMQASYELAEARRAHGWREDIRVGDAVPAVAPCTSIAFRWPPGTAISGRCWPNSFRSFFPGANASRTRAVGVSSHIAAKSDTT